MNVEIIHSGMRDFSITEQDIAISKARWEPEFREFVSRTSSLLASSRRLPIYDQAVELASSWLHASVVDRKAVPEQRSLLLIGDEHLLAACAETLDSRAIDDTHLFPEAWRRWHATSFRGNAWWWFILRWAINDRDRLVELVEDGDSELALKPNETYLLSEASGSRGTDSVCRLIDNRLVVEAPYCEWVDSL